MTDASWIQASPKTREVDLSWLVKPPSPVRSMFAPPLPPPPEPVEPPVERAPAVPPPPPGPSPEEQRMIAQCQQVLAVVGAAISELQDATRIEIGRTAELITEMGLSVAEELAAGVIDVDENRIVALIAEALELLNAEREVKIYLNPDVYEALMSSGALDAVRKEYHVSVRSEARVADRGCIVESPAGQVDARIKSRLRQLRHLIAERQGTKEPS